MIRYDMRIALLFYHKIMHDFVFYWLWVGHLSGKMKPSVLIWTERDDDAAGDGSACGKNRNQLDKLFDPINLF